MNRSLDLHQASESDAHAQTSQAGEDDGNESRPLRVVMSWDSC